LHLKYFACIVHDEAIDGEVIAYRGEYMEVTGESFGKEGLLV
jgi:hypothetical protein